MAGRGRFLSRRLAELEARVCQEQAAIAEDMRRAEIAAVVAIAGIVEREPVGSLSPPVVVDPDAVASRPSHEERLRREYGPEGLRQRLAVLGVGYEDIERIVADLPWWKDYFCDTPRCGFSHGGELGEIN